MSSQQSETLTGDVPVTFPEYAEPPRDPMTLVTRWLDAVRDVVREPRALALATADGRGRPSTRVVAVTEVTPHGLVFTTHECSRKAQEIASNPWASGVLYWRETSQQVVLSGPVVRLGTQDADRLWHARPPGTHAMSVASRQSEDLLDVEGLRARAAALARHTPLPRPERYAAYELRPVVVEFWADGRDRLHERLRYETSVGGWAVRRLQP